MSQLRTVFSAGVLRGAAPHRAAGGADGVVQLGLGADPAGGLAAPALDLPHRPRLRPHTPGPHPQQVAPSPSYCFFIFMSLICLYHLGIFPSPCPGWRARAGEKRP